MMMAVANENLPCCPAPGVLAQQRLYGNRHSFRLQPNTIRRLPGGHGIYLRYLQTNDNERHTQPTDERLFSEWHFHSSRWRREPGSSTRLPAGFAAPQWFDV